MSKQHLTETRLDSFDLAPELLQGLADTGLTLCTPIQAESLPVALGGNDVAGQAQTGTGKTAAFLIAVFQHLISNPPQEGRRPNQPRALILAPTRELAIQIAKDAESIGAHLPFKTVAVYGGTGYQNQRDAVEQGVDVLIGTPGRLIDYFKQHVYNLRQLQALVLDEADRMFDLGFIKDIRYLLRRMPAVDERLSMLFSATMSFRVTELAYEHMNNPVSVDVNTEQVTADRIDQQAYMLANEEKVPLLIGLLRSYEKYRAIIFVNTKRVAEDVWGFLEGNGFKSAILSGDVPQKKRMHLLNQFQQGELNVLVATDVAARGLHIPDVSHVINYDLPEDAEDYVHRIGRTARAGASGSAISFACETYSFSLPDIEAYIGQKLPTESVDPALLAVIEPRSKIRIERKPRSNRNRPNKSGNSAHKHRGRRAGGAPSGKPRN